VARIHVNLDAKHDRKVGKAIETVSDYVEAGLPVISRLSGENRKRLQKQPTMAALRKLHDQIGRLL